MPPPCVFGCTNFDHVHVFPDPKKFPDRFKAWVEIVGGKLETPEDYLKYRRKKVCENHFTEKDKARFNRLTALAVPTLNIKRKASPTTNNEVEREKVAKKLAEHKHQERIKKKQSEIKSYVITEEQNSIVRHRPRSPMLKVNPCKKVYAPRRSGHERKLIKSEEMNQEYKINEKVVRPTAILKFNCAVCDDDIFGAFYVCLECKNFNLCVTCYMKNEHDEHYLLSVPGCKPYSDVQIVVDKLQKQLTSSDDFTKLIPDDIENMDSDNSANTNSERVSQQSKNISKEDPETIIKDELMPEPPIDTTNEDLFTLEDIEKSTLLFEGEIPDPNDSKFDYKDDVEDDSDQVLVDCYTIETDNKQDNSIRYTIVGIDDISMSSEDDRVLAPEAEIKPINHESGEKKDGDSPNLENVMKKPRNKPLDPSLVLPESHIYIQSEKRRACVRCYEKFRSIYTSAEAERKLSKVRGYCSTCRQGFCQKCFGEAHFRFEVDKQKCLD